MHKQIVYSLLSDERASCSGRLVRTLPSCLGLLPQSSLAELGEFVVNDLLEPIYDCRPLFIADLLSLGIPCQRRLKKAGKHVSRHADQRVSWSQPVAIEPPFRVPPRHRLDALPGCGADTFNPLVAEPRIPDLLEAHASFAHC